MLTTLTSEQQQLRDSMERLAQASGLSNPHDLDTVDREKAWSLLADAGVLGLRERDADGGPAGSGIELMIVAEALATALVPVPYLGTAVMAAELLALLGSPLIEGIQDGSTRYGILLTKDLSDLAGQYDLGTAIAWDIDRAGFVLALGAPSTTPADGERTIVRIPVQVSADQPKSVLADFTRSAATLDLDFESAELIGELTAQAYDRWLALATVGICADAVGVMRGALARAVAYSKERVAFGVPIGSFQALQHICADALVQAEAAANHTKYAAWSVDMVEPSEALFRARTAKAYCAAAVRDVPEAAMQVFGGMGHTWEHIAHFFVRRGLVDRELLGGESYQLARIADVRFGVS